MKKFKDNFLKEVGGLEQEEVNLVLECQKKFPSILQNKGEGFCIDGRILWKELEVQKDFSDWIKKQLENVDAIIEKDYISCKGNCSTMRPRANIEYFLTINIAKEICMIAGVAGRPSDKLKTNSKMVRKYFIYMEKALKILQEHISIRLPEKANYNKMIEEIIKDYSNKHLNVTEFDKKYLRIRESNMINQALIGYKASEIKAKLGYLDEQTREHLIVEQNKVINELELMITNLVIAGVDFEERSKIVENICNNKYSLLRMDKEEIIKVS